MTKLLIDIETYSNEDLVSGGVYRYVEGSDFTVLLFAYSVDYAPARLVSLAEGEAIPQDILAALTDPSVVKIAHNMVFEITCLSRYLGIELDVNQWQDTMIEAARLGFPMRLATLGSVLGLEKQKMKEGEALIRFFSCPDKNGRRRPYDTDLAKWETYKAYCLRDVDTEVEVARKVIGCQNIPAWERELQIADYRINRRGVRIDIPFVQNACRFIDLRANELMEEARRITGLENPNSVTQLKQWIHDTTGYRMETLSKESIDDIPVQFLGPKVRRVVEIRKELGKTSVAKYPAMLDCVCQDGRMHGLFQYYGAVQTGRWAGRLVQLQNLAQNHLSDLDYARELVADGSYERFCINYANVNNTLSELIRTALIPSPGNKFIVCDFSAIECRVIAWLAGERWVLDTFRNGGDIYCATAGKMFGVPVEKHGQNAELRQKGKIATLALGYQGGVGALSAMGADRMGLSDEEMRSIVKMWRKANPHIVKLWSTIERSAKAAIYSDRAVASVRGVTFYMRRGILFCLLPSGREIAYPRAKLTGEEDDMRISYERMNQTTKKWEVDETYGGKLAENITQAIARDILGQVILRAESRGIDVVMHIHDEIVVDAPSDMELSTIEQFFSEPISWAPGLPLKGAGYTGSYYYKD